jgi:signal transduction histidine kinase
MDRAIKGSDVQGPFSARRPVAAQQHTGRPVRPARRSLREDRRLVAEVAARLATSLDLGTILLETMRLLHGRFGQGNVGVFLVDGTRRWLELRATYGDMLDPELHRGYRQRVDQGLIGQAFRSEAAVRVDDVAKGARGADRPPGPGSEMAVPLIARGQAIGVLDVQVREPRAFRDRDEALVREVAERLAPTLYNAALYEESQRRAAELEVVADVARAISSQTRPDDVLDEVHRQIRRIMPVDGSTVRLRVGVVAAAWPPGGEEPVPTEPRDALSLAEAGTAGVGQMIVVRSYRGEGRVRDDEGALRSLDRDAARAVRRREPVLTSAGLVAPLLAGDDVLGVVAVASRQPDAYDAWHARLLGTIANQAAVVLHNACLLTLAEGALGELQRSRQQVTAAEERLRREIAELLHGRVQSRLIVAWHRLGQCQRLLMSDPAEANRILADVRDEIDHVREQGLRQASHLLHPAVIAVGLAPAVRSLMARYEDGFASSLQIDERVAELDDPEQNRIPEPLRLTAYRVLEEILANVYRHAQASQVTVRLGVDAFDRLALHVRDDGRGFDPRVRPTGLGLVSIGGRVAQVGGIWSIESAPGAGTTVAVALPMVDTKTVAGPS